jgi:hypothetical protein
MKRKPKVERPYENTIWISEEEFVFLLVRRGQIWPHKKVSQADLEGIMLDLYRTDAPWYGPYEIRDINDGRGKHVFRPYVLDLVEEEWVLQWRRRIVNLRRRRAKAAAKRHLEGRP